MAKKKTEIKSLKKRAIQLLKAGNKVEAIAAQLGLASSTLYKWQRLLRTEGAQGVLKQAVDRRFSLPGHTPGTTERLIRAIAERKPELSADGLVEFFESWGYEVEPRTMRKILSRLGLGRQPTRVSVAADQIIEGRHDDDGLLDRLLIKEVQHSVPKGLKEGAVLVQGRVYLHSAWLRTNLAIELLIDTYDHRIFAAVCDRDDERGAMDLADEAIKYFRHNGHCPGKVFTANQQQYGRSAPGLDYIIQLEKLGVVHAPITSGTRKRDFYIERAWKAVHTEFLEHKRDWLASEDFSILELNDSLDEYLKERHGGSEGGLALECGIDKKTTD